MGFYFILFFLGIFFRSPMCSQVSTYLNFKYNIVMNGTTKFYLTDVSWAKSYEKPPKKKPYFINFSVVLNN
jgi:hypothetical protein